MNSDQPSKILPAATTSLPEPKPQYAIRIKGCLHVSHWSEWFGAMTLTVDARLGETCIVGEIADQAELYGLLARLRNLGLALISVELLSHHGPAGEEPDEKYKAISII